MVLNKQYKIELKNIIKALLIQFINKKYHRPIAIKKELNIIINQIINFFDNFINKSTCEICRNCYCMNKNLKKSSLSDSSIETLYNINYEENQIKPNNEYIKSDINIKFSKISMLELIGNDYNLEYNPIIMIPKKEIELLEFNNTIKYSKFFNSKLLFQKIQMSENCSFENKEFGWVFINNSKLIVKLYIKIKSENYLVLIKCRNKRFKNIQGFDYFTEITYNELFFLCIIKYIIYQNKKDSIRLFQYFLLNLEIYNNKELFSLKCDEFKINPALNIDVSKAIKLNQNYLREDALEFISEGLFFSSNISEINLEENKINDNGILILSHALKSNHINLITLGLSYNVISDVGVKYISDALKINKSIKTLGLYNNNIGNLGVGYLGDMLKYNNTIESINLSKNIFLYDGLKLLIEGIIVNRKLKTIGLEFLNIYDDGAILIRELLINNNIIEGINISNNQICDEGFCSLVDGIMINTKLNKFSIRRNHISDIGIKKLSENIQFNSSLNFLFLQENSIGNQGANLILESLKSLENQIVIYLYDNLVNHEIKVKIRKEEFRIKI